MSATRPSSLNALAFIIIRTIPWNEYNYYDPHCIQENDGARFTKSHIVDSRAKMWTQSSKPMMITTLIDCLSVLRHKCLRDNRPNVNHDYFSQMEWQLGLLFWFVLFFIAIRSKFSTPTFCSFHVCHHLLFGTCTLYWVKKWY